ncbi:MAG: SPOR domain-containing protein [Bacteroidales bacterium]
MFKTPIRTFLLGLGLWMGPLLHPGFGQSIPPSGEEKFASAVALLNSHAYPEALDAFRAMERQGSAGRLLDYYLGRALQLNYHFPEAIQYYQRFASGATRQEKRDYGIDQLITNCRNAMEMTATYNPCKVMNVTFIDLLDSAQFSQIRMKGGQLRYKPADYMEEGETRKEWTSLMFLPSAAVRGEYAYFSGFQRNRRDGAQLFRIRKGAGNTWGDPEEIRELNTAGNEILPYFDPIENDLYFASDGRKGIGGFDLYRAHYDSDRDSWSESMNLGFPINSVMDEVLLLPGTDLGMLMFFTNRQGPDSMVTVYRVHVTEPKKGTDVDNPRMLAEIASMGGAAEDILAELESLRTTPSERTMKQRSSPEPATVSEREPEITPVRILEAPVAGTGTAVMFDEAVRHRDMADSLKKLAVEATVLVRESDDPNDRWVWQKQIMLWEKKSRDEEARADSLFAHLELQQSPASLAGEVPPALQVDTVIDDLTVYRFTGATASDGEPGTSPSVVQGEPDPAPFIYRFDVLDRSPDSPDQPVPMDIPLPAGTFYRIQMGVFSNEVDAELFSGITPITGEWVEERGLMRYYAGKFSRYADASIALDVVREKGFPDAFIVAWYNGKQVPTHTAKQLE